MSLTPCMEGFQKQCGIMDELNDQAARWLHAIGRTAVYAIDSMVIKSKQGQLEQQLALLSTHASSLEND